MSDVLKFPERGVIRDEDGNSIGWRQGYTEEQAKAFMEKNDLIMRAMPIAADMAIERGYQSLFDMPDEDRFALVDEAVIRITPANGNASQAKETNK